jgi:hypothetical protein
MAKRSLGDSPLTKIQNTIDHMKEYDRVVKTSLAHLKLMKGIPITSSELMFSDEKCVEQWITNSAQWNTQLPSESYSPADLCMLARIHAMIARTPNLLTQKNLIKPISVITELQKICRNWSTKEIDVKFIEMTRRMCYIILVMFDQREITRRMVIDAATMEGEEEEEEKGESKEEKKTTASTYKQEMETEEKKFHVSALSSEFLSYATRAFMHIDLSVNMILGKYPVQEVKVDDLYKEKFRVWMADQLSYRPSETMIQSFKEIYYEMVMPLGAELWYQRNPLSGNRISAEKIHATEIPGAEGDIARKQINDKEIVELYGDASGDVDIRLKNAIVFSLYNFLFSTALDRRWREQFTVLECEIRRKYNMITDPSTFGTPRLPLIIQIGPSFYVHHNGRCCMMAGENTRNIENAIILWAGIVVNEFDSKLSFGEDASEWFKLFS